MAAMSRSAHLPGFAARRRERTMRAAPRTNLRTTQAHNPQEMTSPASRSASVPQFRHQAEEPISSRGGKAEISGIPPPSGRSTAGGPNSNRAMEIAARIAAATTPLGRASRSPLPGELMRPPPR